MTCDRCPLLVPHLHYPDWLRLPFAGERCRCGRHARAIATEAVLFAWYRRHARGAA